MLRIRVIRPSLGGKIGKQINSIKLVLAILLLAAVQSQVVAIVSAHGNLVESQPADGAVLEHSPEQVVATFSEELESGSSTLAVFDAGGNQVDNGDGGVDLNDLDHLSMIVTLPTLGDGSYSVRWTAVSAEDGDETEGSFSFVVGGNSPSSGSSSQPSGGISSLIYGVIIGGALILLAAMVIYFRRKQTANDGLSKE